MIPLFENMSPWARMAIWIGVVVLLPVLGYPLEKRILELESNGATFSLLFSFVTIALLLSLTLMGFSIQGVFQFILFLLSLILSAAYDYCALNVIDRFR